MTKREFLNKVITLIDDKEVIEMAKSEIALLDKKNDKAKEQKLAKAELDKPTMDKIVAYLGTHTKAVGSELATVCEISTPKAIALCKKLVANGIVNENEITIPKVGKRKVYSLK